MKIRTRAWAGLLILILGITLVVYLDYKTPKQCSSVVQTTLLTENFEQLPLSDEWGYEAFNSSRIQLSNDYIAQGIYSLKFTVFPGELVNKGARSEVVLLNSDPICSEAWYSWKFLIPANYSDNASAGWQLMGQWHDQPDGMLGETWSSYPAHSPMISLFYGCIDTGCGVALKYGINNVKIVNQTYLTKDVWNTVVFHVFWSQTAEGFCELYINGNPITPYNGNDFKYFGANMYNKAPAYLKLGLYRDPYQSTINSVYFDAFVRSSSPLI